MHNFKLKKKTVSRNDSYWTNPSKCYCNLYFRYLSILNGNSSGGSKYILNKIIQMPRIDKGHCLWNLFLENFGWDWHMYLFIPSQVIWNFSDNESTMKPIWNICAISMNISNFISKFHFFLNIYLNLILLINGQWAFYF